MECGPLQNNTQRVYVSRTLGLELIWPARMQTWVVRTTPISRLYDAAVRQEVSHPVRDKDSCGEKSIGSGKMIVTRCIAGPGKGGISPEWRDVG
jgi:hypothetical protein